MSSTAARCACATACCVAGSARAHSTLADFGTVNVRSNPATAFGPGRAASTCWIWVTIAARRSEDRSAGRAAVFAATRSASGRNTG